MHELGLVRAVALAAERRAAGRAVAVVRIRIGALHRTMPEAMRFAFESLVAGTALEGATLDVRTVPLTSTCLECGRSEAADDPIPVCAACGATAIRFAGGDELQLESIDYRTTPERAAEAAAVPAGAGG